MLPPMSASPPPPWRPHPSRRAVLALGSGLVAGAGLGGCHLPAAGAGGPWEAPDPGPIRPQELRARRKRLAALCAEASVDAFLVEPSASLVYLSGISWRRSERLFALVVLADGTDFWVVPAFEEPKARLVLERADDPDPSVVTWDEHEYAWRPLASALEARGVERVAVEPQARAFVPAELGAVLGRERVLSGASLTRALRGRKDAHELALMRSACERTQLALGRTADQLRAGMTSGAIGALVRGEQEALGLDGVWQLALIGPDAAYPHGNEAERRLARGDGILIDTGGSLHGYQSDITRSWIFDGAPSREYERAWNTVRDAQERAFETLGPGVPCGRADAAARAVIEGAGFGSGYASFTHRLGHGIGLEVHEEPYLDGGNELPLAEGMTFSDEPGIYLYGRFGIRLEDIVAITAEGADHFGDWQGSPRHPGS